MFVCVCVHVRFIHHPGMLCCFAYIHLCLLQKFKSSPRKYTSSADHVEPNSASKTHSNQLQRWMQPLSSSTSRTSSADHIYVGSSSSKDIYAIWRSFCWHRLYIYIPCKVLLAKMKETHSSRPQRPIALVLKNRQASATVNSLYLYALKREWAIVETLAKQKRIAWRRESQDPRWWRELEHREEPLILHVFVCAYAMGIADNNWIGPTNF